MWVQGFLFRPTSIISCVLQVRLQVWRPVGVGPAGSLEDGAGSRFRLVAEHRVIPTSIGLHEVSGQGCVCSNTDKHTHIARVHTTHTCVNTYIHAHAKQTNTVRHTKTQMQT